MPKPNPNRVDRQKRPDSPPPPSQGEREAPGDTTDWIEVGHEEAEAQRRRGDVVPGGPNAPGGNRPHPPRTRG